MKVVSNKSGFQRNCFRRNGGNKTVGKTRQKKKGNFSQFRGRKSKKSGLVKVWASPRHHGEEEKEMDDGTTAEKSLSFLTQGGGG